MAGGNPKVDFNVFENYSVCILRPLNIETGDPELKIIAEKNQDKDKFILKNSLINSKLNQTIDMMEETETYIMVNFNHVTCIHCKPRLLLEEDNITASF